MRSWLTIIAGLLLCAGCQENSEYKQRIDAIRAQTSESFTNPTQSPLDSNERKYFKGINFYEVDDNYHVDADLIWLPQMGFVDLKHSGGDTKPYMKAGQLHFSLNGRICSLTAFQTEAMRREHKLFVPFADATNGSETYGGGRYLDISYNPAAAEKVILDFNLAYAPYCAYTHRYSCPLVPAENTLPISIRAGERQ